jgi:dTDP-4-amino-4,6-dideoxygalactose transaminase
MTARKEFLTFGRPLIGREEIDEVVDCLTSGWLGTGPKVQRFERDFAALKGVPEVAAVGSCTAALHLAMIAEGFQPGDEVITTDLTFCATVNAILHAGATPVLADCDRRTMNLDPAQVAAKITPRTRAILPVHFAGRMCEMDALMDLARRHGLKVIEDCAHAIESTYHGRPSGTFGDVGCFSFYVTKNVACGEGGMVIARNPETLGRVKVLALHGMSRDAWQRFSDKGYRHYQVTECGFKYNMMDLQAAIGIHQLAKMERHWERRREIWGRYDKAFADLPMVLPAPPAPDTRHGHHLYVVLLNLEELAISRDEFMNELTQRKIGVGVHYLPIHTHPYYQAHLGFRAEDFPNASWIGERTVSLPLSPSMTDQDVADVIGVVGETLAQHRR